MDTMTLGDYIFKFFRISLIRTPNGFLKKFLKESSNKFVIFEMYYKNKLIIQLENEKYIEAGILKKTNSDNKLPLGYVLSFALPAKGIESNKNYKNYQAVSHSLKMIEINFPNLGLIGFNKRIDNKSSLYEIGNQIKKVVSAVYKFKEENPRITYNLRYPDPARFKS